jgi:hypothetical protein
LTNGWAPPESLDGTENGWPRNRLESLSYVVGVLLKGDGSVSQSIRRPHRHDASPRIVYRIELKVKSMRFAEEFNLRFARVMDRPKVKILGPYGGRFQVQYFAKQFFVWWKSQPARVFLRIARAFPVAYLRGRFDSDGNVNDYSITLCGAESHKTVLEFDRALCLGLGMRTGKVRPYGHVGETAWIDNKPIISREQRLRFSVNTKDFLRVIRKFNVEWRDDKLKSAIKGRTWTSWPPRVRKRAVALQRRNNWQCYRIASELAKELDQQVPYTTVYGWLKQNRRTWQEFADERGYLD